MTSASRATPGFERCDRPSSAFDSTACDQPGRLAQGPDEKHGLAGRRVGFVIPPFLALGPLPGCRFQERRKLSAAPARVNAGARKAPTAEPRRLLLEDPDCNRPGGLENRQADPAGLPSLTYLFLDNETRRGHR